MFRAVEQFRVNLRIRVHLRRIEHTQLDSRRVQADQGSVDLVLGQDSLLIGVEVGLVVVVVFHLGYEIHALIVNAALQSQSRSLGLGLGEVMVAVDVDDRLAIRDDISLKMPSSPQLVLQKKLVGTGGLPIDAVVGTHDRAGFPLDYGRAECRQIRVQLIMLAHFDVNRVAGWLGPAVYGVMLGRRNDAIVIRVVTLHTGDKCNPHARRQEGILSKRFLSTAPARIAKDVNVRSPEIEALKDIAMPVTQTLDVLDSPFGADHDCHTVNRSEEHTYELQ